MRKTILSLMVMIMMSLPLVLRAQELAVAFADGFEEGLSELLWTQETDNSAVNILWDTESGSALQRPTGAAQGVARAYLRNNTGKPLGYSTKLVTKSLDLSSANNWVLTFKHAQYGRAGNADELRVYYRRTSTDAWVLLAQYTEPINNWKTESLPLPRVSSTYQIAFEGKDNNVYGVVLDDVQVTEENDCTTPHDLSVSALTSTGANLIWVASYDAEYFQVLVQEGEPVEDQSTLDASKAKQTTDGLTFNMQLTGLEAGKTYTAYVRSFCGDNTYSNEWGTLTFTTRTVVNLPYTENFSVHTNNVVKGWTHKSNTDGLAPVVRGSLGNLDVYPTGNMLAFLTTATGNPGANGIVSATGEPAYFKAGQWGYAATPEINVDLKKCEVSFYAGLGAYATRSWFERSVIVGVMTDPDDVSTFEAIKTIKLWKSWDVDWENYIVDLSGYTGNGKYVAFLTNFQTPNMIFIDDVTVRERPAVGSVASADYSMNFDQKKLYIEWPKVENATGYNVKIVQKNPSLVVINTKQYTVTDNRWEIQELENSGQYYWISVQATNGSQNGAWSDDWRFVAPAPVAETFPISFGFESSEQTLRTFYDGDYNDDLTVPRNVATYSNAKWLFPNISNNLKNGGIYALMALWAEEGMEMEYGTEAWAVFPAVDIVDTLNMDFYMNYLPSGPYSFKGDYANVVVGVMTDPTDYYSFEPVATFLQTENKWLHYNVSFASYKGNGHFIAIRFVSDEKMGSNLINAAVIDDVTIGGQPACAVPQNIQLTAYNETDFTISWEGQGNKYNVVVANSTLTEAQLDAVTAVGDAVLAYKTDLTAQQLTISYTDELTQGRRYVVYVQNVCDQSSKSWSSAAYIDIPAPERLTLPYYENFDSYENKATPAGWTKLSINEYPYVYVNSAANQTVGGKAGLYLYNSVTTTSKASIGGYISAPLLKIEDMHDLMLTFSAKALAARNIGTTSPNVIDTLYVGVMADPNDADSWTLLEEIPVNSNTVWSKHTVSFDKWQPYMGEYVTFTSRHDLNYIGGAYRNTNNNIYVDDVTFLNAVDAAAFNLEVSDIEGDKATINWAGKVSQGWKVIVSEENVEPTQAPSITNTIFNSVVSANTVTVTGLEGQTHYFVYIKPVAADDDIWVKIEFLSACLKLDPQKSFYYLDFETEDHPTTNGKTVFLAPDCWTPAFFNETSSSTDSHKPGTYRYPEGTATTAIDYAHAGLNSFYIFGQNERGAGALISPEVSGNVGDWTISFWCRPASAAYPIYLAVMTDPNDPTTATKLQEIKVGSTIWAQYTFKLDELGYQPQMGQYIALTADIWGTTSSGAYIDDIILSTTGCTGPDILFSNLTHNSIAVRTMNVDDNATKVNMVLVKDATLEQSKLNNNLESYLASLGDKVVANRTLTSVIGENLTDLLPATSYSIALQGTCGDGLSPWTVASFATMGEPKTPAEFGIVDFENYPETADYKKLAQNRNGENTQMPGWARGNQTGIGNWPLVFCNVGTAATQQLSPNGMHSLNLYSTSTIYGAYAIMPALNVTDEDLTKYRVQFKARINSAGTTLATYYPDDCQNSIIVGLISDPADLSTFVALDTITVNDLNVLDAEVRFSQYKGDNTGKIGKHLMFSSNFRKTNVFFVDDIQFSLIPECVEPTNVKVDAAIESATITFKSQTQQTKVFVSLEEVEEAARTDYKDYVFAQTVTGNSVVVNNLSGNTMYYVYVASECKDELYWATPVYFKTACGAMEELPYYENFDNYSPPTGNSRMIPDCWTVFYDKNKYINNIGIGTSPNTNARYPSIPTATTGHNGTKYLNFGRTTKTTTPDVATRPTGVTPKFSGPMDNLLISFWYQVTATSPNNAGAMLVLGLASDVTDLTTLYNTFVPIDTLRHKIGEGTDWKEYSVTTEHLAGQNLNDMHLVLTSVVQEEDGISYYLTIYIDELSVKKLPTCYSPHDLAITNIRPETATLSFVPTKETETKWDVAYMEAGAQELTTFGTFDKTQVEITGLKPMTEYTAYVRANCKEDDQSEYSTISFRTLDKITDTAFYGFENEGENAELISSGRYYNPSLVVNNAYNYVGNARTGDNSLVLQYGSWVVLPQIVNADSKQIRLDMRAINTTASTVATNRTYPYVTLEIGTVTAYGDYTDFEVLGEYKTSAYIDGEAINENKDLMFDQVVMALPNLEGKQLALRLASPNTSSNYNYLFIDNLKIEQAQGFSTPVIAGNSVIDTESLTFEWNAQAGVKYNVYLTDDAAIFPLNVAQAVKKIENVEVGTVNFTGLAADKQYFAFLQIAGKEDKAAISARKAYKTPSALVKLPTNSVIGFEDPLAGVVFGNAASTQTADQPSVVENSGNTSYSYEGTHALMLNNSHAYDYSYVVAPYIASDRLDTLQVNFVARPFVATGGKATNGSKEQITLDAPFQPLHVGTVTDPNDISTFEEIAPLYYSNTEITYETDATAADKLFESFSFRLGNTNGKFVAIVVDTIASWYIDNIEIGQQTCIAPVKLNVVSATTDEAVLTWTAFDNTYVEVQVATDRQFTSIVHEETLLADTCVAQELDGGMTYYWRVRQVCGDNDNSAWSAVSTFNTICKAATTYFTSFEPEDGYLKINERETADNAPLKPFCWTVGYDGATSQNSSYAPHIVTNSLTNGYSHQNSEFSNNAALEMETYWYYTGNSVNRAQRAWAIMPEIDADLQDMELTFWMSPYQYKGNNISASYYYNEGTTPAYARTVFVGTVTDPNDISTFQVLDTITYDGVELPINTWVDTDNNYGYAQYTVSLKNATGKYITFLCDNDMYRNMHPEFTTYVRNHIFIDDVMVEPASGCVTPAKRETENITEKSALLKWQGEENASYRVTVALDAAMNNVVVKDTIEATQYQLNNLAASTTYYWRVAQICGEGMESAESGITSFNTLLAPYFYEDFQSVPSPSRVPDGWSSVQMNAKDVFAGKQLPTTQNYNTGWGITRNVTTGEVKMVARCTSSTSSGYNEPRYSWLVSPTLRLGEDMPSTLSFNLSVNAATLTVNTEDPMNKGGVDDQFMVIVSEDDGKTWKQENAVIWNNENDESTTHYYGNGDYVFDQLPYTKPTYKPQDRFFIDLEKYKGKDIKVAFYLESSVVNVTNLFTLWDVRVAYQYENVEVYENCLYGEDKEWNGYVVNSVSRGQVTAGEHTFHVMSYATDERKLIDPLDQMIDTLYTLKATLWEVPETVENASICQGESFTWNGVEYDKAGDYNIYLQTTNGCDSIVTLHLEVLPVVEVEVEDEICLGRAFVLNGVSYYENTIVYDTLSQVNSPLGCDSIVKHIVTFKAMEPYEYAAQSCQGVPYYFTENYPALTEPGRYQDVIKTAEGCDSTVIVNLTFTEIIRTTQELTFCTGGSVEFNGKVYTAPTQEEIEMTNEDGCPMIVNLIVTEVEKFNIELNAFICQGSTYNDNGFEVSQAGTYTLNLQSTQGCDSTVVLHLEYYPEEPIEIDTTITVDQLPYMFNYYGMPVPGITYPLGTEPGVYEKEVDMTVDDGCVITFHHKLTVVPTTGLDQLRGELLINPNLINKGDNVTINGTFTTDELNSMKVEVYDATGKRINAVQSSMMPLELGGFYTSGIYTVTLTTSNGKFFTGRVIVK